MSSNTIPADPVTSRAVKSAQSQLAKLEQELAKEAEQQNALETQKAATEAKIAAEEKAHPSEKKKLEAELAKDEAKFKKDEKALSSKMNEGKTQESALQSKVQALLQKEQSAEARGFHWAPDLAAEAQYYGKAIGSDEKQLAKEKKTVAAAEKQIDALIDAKEKKDPANKATYEQLRTQMKAQAAAALKPDQAKLRSDKSNLKELQTELNARTAFLDKSSAAKEKSIQAKYAAKIKADGSNKKKVAADKAAEQKELAKAKLNAKTLALRGKEAQTDISLAEKGKAVPNWKNVKAQPPQPKVKYGEPWKPGPGTLFGADTSNWESESQFDASIKNAQFSAIKATEGTGYTDPTFASRWHKMGELVKQGKMKLRMAYCFLDGGESGRAQADHFLNTLGIHGKLPAGTRLALDWEGSALNDPSALRDAAKRIHDVTGLWPVVYCQGSEVGRAQSIVPNAPLWEAEVADSAGDALPSSQRNRNVAFFQYAWKPYDLDQFNGNLAALEKFAGWKS